MDEITLRIRKRHIAFRKSARYVGIERSTNQDALGLNSLGASTRASTFGPFELVDASTEASEWQGLQPSASDGTSSARAETFVDAARKAGIKATHVYHTSPDNVPFVPTGLLFVQFREGTSARERDAVIAKARLEKVGERHGFTILQVTAQSPNPMKVAASLQGNPLIKSAEPDLSTPFKRPASASSADFLLRDAWQLENRGCHQNIGAVWFTKGVDVRVRGAWARLGTRGNPAVRVAIIDDGFFLEHKDLDAPGRWQEPRNFGGGTSTRPGVPADEDPSPRTLDDQHGTECAGLIGGLDDGDGVVGVAPHCTIVPVRWSNNPGGLDLDAWFTHASDSGASVINCSWGPGARVFELTSFQEAAIHAAATNAREGRGALVVMAAGNDGVDPSGATLEWLNGFLNLGDVIVVSGLNSKGTRWNGSNFGECITLCAPAGGGGDKASIRSCGVRKNGTALVGAYNANFGGTSAAAALVSGVAALVFSVDPSLRASQVREILIQSTWKPGDPKDYVNGRHHEFGFGCVNASDAVAAV